AAWRLGYHSRSAFKLIELSEKDKLCRGGMTVVDLGAAPGSWCPVLRERLGPQAKIVAADILPMTPLPAVRFVQADFSNDEGLAAVQSALGAARAALVLS